MRSSVTRNRPGSDRNLRSTAQVLRVYRAHAKRIHRNFVSAGPEKLRLLAFLFVFTICSFLTYFYLKSNVSEHRSDIGPLVAHIGTSNVDVTPHELVPLSGFASRKSPPTTTKLLTPWAPLRVRALVLQFANVTTTPRLVFVSMDIIGISRNFSDSVFSELFQVYRLTRRDVRLISSHTHSGPAVLNTLTALLPDNTDYSAITRYTNELRNAIVRAVGEALASAGKAGPSHLYQNVGNVEIGVNRRQVEERLFNERTDRGTVDSEVPVMWFRESTGNKAIIAGMYGMSAHATVLTTSNQYSGDYPSAVSTALEARFPHSTWLYLPGCGGDINIYPRGTVDLLKLHRDIIVSEVRRVVETESSITPIMSHVVSARHTQLRLAFRTQVGYTDLRRYAQSGDRATKRSAKNLLHGMRQGEKTTGSYEIPMSTWQIGRVKILFLGGEPTVGYATKLRDDVVGATWIVGYTDEVMGYIGTEQVLREMKREGSDRAALYYGLPCAWNPSVERSIVERARELCS